MSKAHDLRSYEYFYLLEELPKYIMETKANIPENLLQRLDDLSVNLPKKN